jgi:hypothetical protein
VRLFCGFHVGHINFFFILGVFFWGGEDNGSQCSGNKNKSKTFVHNFYERWDNKYFFDNVNNKGMCLICNFSLAISKKCNVE